MRLKGKKVDIRTLHPSVFACNSRIDVIYENVNWQKKYRYISFAHAKIGLKFMGAGANHGHKRVLEEPVMAL